MKPKKKSSLILWIGAASLVFVLYLGYCIGAAVHDANMDGIYGGSELFSSIMNYVTIRLSQEITDDFVWNATVQKSVMLSAGVWFIIVLMIYSQNQKNFIKGKEYGTAKWATQADIRDLFAQNIMNNEIRRAKRLRNPFNRTLVKKEVRKECQELATESERPNLEFSERWKQELIDRHEFTRAKKAEYKKDQAAIKAEIKRQTDLYFKDAWKPYAINAAYKARVEEIKSLHEQGIVITTDDQKKEELAKAAKIRKMSLAEFYSGKSRIDQIRKKYENADALLTATERVSIYNYVLNNNILIIGGSGAGKTRGFVIPNILQAHSSFVVTDPKGEILEKIGYFLEKVHGYKIHTLDLDNKPQSDCYNPFAYVYPERAGYEERVLSLIDVLILNTDGGQKKESSDPFWEKAEKMFLQAVFFFTCDGFVEKDRNFNTVLHLISMLELAEEDDDQNSPLDIFAREHEKNLNEADTENHNAGTYNVGIQQYKEFRQKASGKTAKSIVISALARLAPFRTKEIRRIFSCDTMQLDRLGEEKTAVFVVVPPTEETCNFISGMLFSQMFQELQYCATQIHKHEGQRLPIPVRFILDEFATTCRIPNFTKILAYARSLGIGIVPIIQSLEQLKAGYEKDWGTIIDNCNALLYLGQVTHTETLKYMSEILGKGTFDKKTTGRSKGKSGSFSENFDVIGRELMDPAEIRKMPKKDCLLILGGRNPFYSEKYKYESHPNYRYTSDAHSQYGYTHVPVTQITQDSPHGEDDEEFTDVSTMTQAEIEAAASERMAAILERIDESKDIIRISQNPREMLSNLNKCHANLRPAVLEIPEEFEPAIEDINALLGFEETDSMIDEIMDRIHDRVEEAVNSERITLTTDAAEVGSTLLDAGKSLAVADVDMLGEENTDDVQEFMDKIESEHDENGDEQKPELSESHDIVDYEEPEKVDDDFGDLSTDLDGLLGDLESVLTAL